MLKKKVARTSRTLSEVFFFVDISGGGTSKLEEVTAFAFLPTSRRRKKKRITENFAELKVQ